MQKYYCAIQSSLLSKMQTQNRISSSSSPSSSKFKSKSSKIYTKEILNLYTRLFERINSISPMILQWDNKSNFLLPSSANLHESYFTWYFNVFIITGLFGFGSCLTVIFHASEVKIGLLLICIT